MTDEHREELLGWAVILTIATPLLAVFIPFVIALWRWALK